LTLAEKMVTISEKEYLKLKERSAWLGYLEAAGVDNWDGYSYAYDIKLEAEGKDVE
jgi:hypothetical protein